ncbi:MAG TPA: HD domain-containing protein, partial [Proteobacteria bacterium]|nr:HD domain-containing protein [Pseudomonadota bacterium]
MRNLLKNPFATFSLAALIVVILVAGLRPFNFAPKNRVTHTEKGGLTFSRPGIAYSADMIDLGPEAFTVELLYKTDRSHSYGIPRILSVSDANGNEIFFIGTWRSSIIVRNVNAQGSRSGREIGVRDAAGVGETHLLTVTTSQEGTSIFLDGKLVKEAPDFSILREGIPLMGRLVLGNSPDGSNQWYGEILGVGVFNRRMNPAVAGDAEILARSAKFHDLGRIAIDEALLSKAGDLAEDEREQVKAHPIWSYRILESIPGMDVDLEAVKAHHERYDGKGYPDGLLGEEIPMGARILAVADCYDALTSDRPYRAAMKREEALKVMDNNNWSQFDGRVVKAFK